MFVRRERPRRPIPPPPSSYEFVDVVTKVADGDTLTLRGFGRVRLRGVDCPEGRQLGGREATAYTRRRLLGQRVEIELCRAQAYDRYGRGLAFVYLPEGGRRVFFNRELVEEGYARVYSRGSCAVDEAIWWRWYEDARRAGKGLAGIYGEVPNPGKWRQEHRR